MFPNDLDHIWFPKYLNKKGLLSSPLHTQKKHILFGLKKKKFFKEQLNLKYHLMYNHWVCTQFIRNISILHKVKVYHLRPQINVFLYIQPKTQGNSVSFALLSE